MTINKRLLFALILAISIVTVVILVTGRGDSARPREPTWQTTELPTPPRGQTLTVHFIDVGQGASTLLVGPDFTVLVDAGCYDRDDVVPYLQSVGVTSIDLLVGTHPHADHIGQFPQVLDTFPVREVWMNGATHTTLTFEQALDAILASDAGYHEPRAGEVINIGSLRLEVLHPEALSGDLNDDSIVLRAVFGEFRVLLPGDAGWPVEEHMVRQGYPLQAQVLQVGHHGSHTSTCEALLRQVAPEMAVYSAGQGNPYGHPHDSVLERLAWFDIPVYGTDQCGTIIVRSDGHGFEVDAACHAAEPMLEPTEMVAPLSPTPFVLVTSAAEQANETPTGCEEGQININTASREELDRIIHIGNQRAGQILRLRPFSSVDDMIRIKGIGPARLGDIKEQELACVQSTQPPAVVQSTPLPTPTYVCDCGKTCGTMSSCEEAYFQLQQCGCGRRDGDGDGVPCEDICFGR